MEPIDKKQGVTAKTVRDLFIYNPKTGDFLYRVKRKYQIHGIGQPAGYVRSGKYLIIKINGHPYYAHRLAWLYVYGVWPEKLLDHINGNKLDNRIENLRPATQAQNKSNGSKYSNNASGYKGVVKCGNKWKAQITHGMKVYYLGLHETKEEAHEAYLKAAKGLKNEFARS